MRNSTHQRIAIFTTTRTHSKSTDPCNLQESTKQVGAKSERTTTTTKQLKCNKVQTSQLNIKQKQHQAQYSKNTGRNFSRIPKK
jgi:hypothetical protein